MQILITHGSMARTRVLRLNRWQLGAGLLAMAALPMLLSGVIYSAVFVKATREGWPVVSQIVRPVVRDESVQRDRFLRENLDALAQRVGEVQAKLIRLGAIGERVAGQVGVKPEAPEPGAKAAPVGGPGTRHGGGPGGGEGGPFVPYAAGGAPSLEELGRLVDALDAQADRRSDLFTLLESRLSALMVPNSKPVDGPVGSGFGFRADPFTGRAALHTGLDFPAEAGTPVRAAAGGVVLSSAWHPEFGNLVELDHGNGLVTRYAHNSKVRVHVGDLVKRGQVVSEVGTTGRSTGPHLHFEVLLDGVPQDPARFLAGSGGAATLASARPPHPRR